MTIVVERTLDGWICKARFLLLRRGNWGSNCNSMDVRVKLGALNMIYVKYHESVDITDVFALKIVLCTRFDNQCNSFKF